MFSYVLIFYIYCYIIYLVYVGIEKGSFMKKYFNLYVILSSKLKLSMIKSR